MMPKPQLFELLEQVISLATEMGNLLIYEWEREDGPRGSGSTANIDTEIEEYLRTHLLSLLDGDYWGEETGSHLTGNPYCWVVDPHDGTSDFLRGLPGSSISIGLLHNQVPVLGVVYAPISPDRGEDCIAWAEGMSYLLRNGQQIKVDLSNAELDGNSRVWLSAAAMQKPTTNAELCHPARFIAQTSIAYRLARVAAGDGVCACSIVSLSAHDVAAAHALLRGAGGVLLKENGQAVDYKNMDYVSKYCFGGAPSVCKELLARKWDKALSGPNEIKGFTKEQRKFPHINIMSRAIGCLTGLISGDNIGAQVEFMSEDSIARKGFSASPNMSDGGVWNILAGQATDDGEMALTLSHSLVERQTWDINHAATSYVKWLYSKPFDIGNTISQALNGPAQLPDLEVSAACQQAANPESQANGALMRAAPLGIAAWHNPTLAAQWAREDARLTHPNQVCLDANAAYAAAIATGICGGTRQEMLAAALENVETSEAVRNCIIAASSANPVEDFQHNMGWVLTALQNAFYHLMRESSIEEAILQTTLKGGDSDTNASIVGALIGAVDGLKDCPNEWSLHIACCRPINSFRARPHQYWPCDIAQIGQALVSIKYA